MKILITDKIIDEGLDILRDKGYEVDTMYDLSYEELLDIVGPYDAMIVRSSTTVDAKVIEAARNCKVIGRAGVTYDNIDVETATEAGIVVCNVPASNAISTAEHTMALMLAAAREISAADETLHSGEWCRDFFLGHELYDKMLVIFGLGNIGGLVAERARAFGMHVVGYDPYCSTVRASQLGVTLVDDFNQALGMADFITVHVPLTDETYHMLSANEFARMKNGVIIVNTARGGVIDEEALAEFMDAGKVFGCGIDMLEHEPNTETPLLEFDRAVLTPHLGANTEEAQIRAGKAIARYVANGLEGLVVPTALNMVPADVAEAVAAYIPACQMCGRIMSRMAKTIPQNLTIMASGDCASDLHVLAAAALGGILSCEGQASVSAENVEASALRHGIKLEMAVSADSRGYDSLVSIEADGLEIAVTVPGTQREMHIVSIQRYRVDVVPSDNMLIFTYKDQLGQVGRIGTILGNAGINISTMVIGKRVGCDEALVFLNVEQPVPTKTVVEVSRAIKAVNAWNLSL